MKQFLVIYKLIILDIIINIRYLLITIIFITLYFKY